MDDNKSQKSDELSAIPSDISVSVKSKDGKQTEYVFPLSVPSDVIVLKSTASTSAELGIQVLQPWKDKMMAEIDDIKENLLLEEVELNFGIAKFKFKRKPKY